MRCRRSHTRSRMRTWRIIVHSPAHPSTAQDLALRTRTSRRGTVNSSYAVHRLKTMDVANTKTSKRCRASATTQNADCVVQPKSAWCRRGLPSTSYAWPQRAKSERLRSSRKCPFLPVRTFETHSSKKGMRGAAHSNMWHFLVSILYYLLKVLRTS